MKVQKIPVEELPSYALVSLSGFRIEYFPNLCNSRKTDERVALIPTILSTKSLSKRCTDFCYMLCIHF